MLKKLAHVKINTYLNLAFGLAFIAAAMLVAFLVNSVMRQQALVEAESKARVLLDRNLATHTYFSQILKPSLFQWTAPFRPDDYFDPSWMSSTYAVRQIGKYFKASSPADYDMKDAAVNARSPENEADAYEKAFLDDLKTDPKLVTRSSVRTLEGVSYFVFLRAGEVMEKDCLRCHGDPSQAPAGLVRLYGAESSFHRETDLGQVMSAISIRVPLSAAYAEADRFSAQLSGLLLASLAGLFLAQYWLNKRLLFAPLTAIRDKALQVSTDENRLGEQIPVPFGQELSEMATAFNRMSATLRRDRDRLEERITERTADLTTANERLERDITERRRLEEILEKERQELELIIDTSPIIVFYKDKEGRFVRVNKTFAESLKMPGEDFVGKTVFDLYSPKIAQGMTDDDQEVLESRRAKLDIIEQYESAGGIRWVQTDKFPICDKNGIPVGLIGFAQDITERKRAEEALRASEERYRTTVMSVGDGVIATDTQGRVDLLNPVAEALTGWRQEQARGKLLEEVWRIINQETRQPIENPVRRVMREGLVVGLANHTVLIARDGTEYPLADSGAPIRDEKGEITGVVLVFRDQTEERAAQKALRAAEAQFRSLFENVPDGVYRSTLEGKFLIVNPALVRMLGYASAEELFAIDIPRHMYADPEARRAWAAKLLQEGELRNVEIAIRRKDGQPLAGLENTRVVRDERGNVLYFEGTLTDITERKRAEDALRASLAEREVLLKEVYHRVKNNLTAIIGLINMHEAGATDPATATLLVELDGRIRSMALVHESLYESKDLAHIDLQDYLETLIAEMRASWEPRVGAERGASGVHFSVEAAGVEMGLDIAVPCGLILNELITNAFKYAFPGGQPRPGEKACEITVSAEWDGGAYTLVVADNGVGLPADLDWTTAPKTLGLRLVRLLAQHQLGGHMEIDRTGGTRFTLKFTPRNRR